MKTVYCVVVTFNGMSWIEKCLTCLTESRYPVHIVVIDNSSTDNTVAFIRAQFPDVMLDARKTNLGFGQGNNAGFRIALQNKADYIFLLNQDAYIQPNTIGELVTAHQAHPEYGILSPLHLNGEGSDFEEHFYTYLTKSDIKDRMRSDFLGRKLQKVPIESPFVNAAAWLVDADCMYKVGGFDPIFFHYGEDNHYIQRAKYFGFKIGIWPDARILHDKGRPEEIRPVNLNQGINKDWILFLTHVCDLRNSPYLKIMLRRSLRHILQWFSGLITLNKQKRIYNYTFVRNIFGSIRKVKKSREICLRSKTPYL